MTGRAARRAACAALALFVVVGAVSSTRSQMVVVVSAVVAIGAGLLIASTGWRVMAMATLAGTAVTVLCSGSSSNVGWFAVCVLTGWCVLKAGTVPGAGFAACAVVVFVAEWVGGEGDPGWAAWIAGTLFTVAICVMGRRQLELVDELRLAQAGLADRTRADERNRIARELHDVMAHSLTVSLLHLTSARLAVEEDPAGASTALAEAERLARESLAEVRQAVGLMREPIGSTATPAPGIDQLPGLVDGFRRAGTPVTYEVRGDPSRLSPTVGLTVYRILQEALTNAARHAPGRAARVHMDVAAARTLLTVDNNSTTRAQAGDGVGLHSMRERAEALGGVVTAGPTESGWCVRAVLPGHTSGTLGAVAGSR
jgi:signal transduction histidine kinase